MSHFRRLSTYCASLGLLWSLFLSSQAQPPGPYGPYIPTEDFVRAVDLLQSDDFESGIALMKKVAEDNRGRILRAVALGQLASYTTNKSERLNYCQKMVEEFPGSCLEIVGRQKYLRYQSDGNFSRHADDLDNLVHRYGGPRRKTVQEKHPALLAYQVRRLPWEHQKGLSAVYQELFYKTTTDSHTSFGYARFMRLAFPFVDDDSAYAMSELRIYYQRLRFGTRNDLQMPVESVSPVIQFDNRRVCGPRPKLRFRAWTGAFPTPEISLGKMIFNVDGQDARLSLDLDSDMDTKLTGKVPFETLFFTYRPKQKLAKGRHTIFIQLTTSNYNPSRTVGITKIEVPFQVSEDDDSPDDKAEEQFQDRW